VDVVVEGRLRRDGVFHATVLTAKCASRYENAPAAPGSDAGAAKHGGYDDKYQNTPGYRAAKPAGSGA
jgi:cytochrome c-type biogenesis protein CcmE